MNTFYDACTITPQYQSPHQMRSAQLYTFQKYDGVPKFNEISAVAEGPRDAL